MRKSSILIPLQFDKAVEAALCNKLEKMGLYDPEMTDQSSADLAKSSTDEFITSLPKNARSSPPQVGSDFVKPSAKMKPGQKHKGKGKGKGKQQKDIDSESSGRRPSKHGPRNGPI